MVQLLPYLLKQAATCPAATLLALAASAIESTGALLRLLDRQALTRQQLGKWITQLAVLQHDNPGVFAEDGETNSAAC